MACSYSRRRPALGARGDVRRHDHVVTPEQGMSGRQRFGIGDVEAGAREVATVERVEQRFLVDQAHPSRS